MTGSDERDNDVAGHGVAATASEDSPVPEDTTEHNTETGTGESDGQHFDPVTAHPDVVELGYEQARDELADVVRRLEAGGLSLEDSLALWERGEALATMCERHLAGAQERVDRALSAVREDEQ